MKLYNEYEIFENDIYDNNFLSNFNSKFDIIFLDPPFKDKNLQHILLKIKNLKVLNENGIIILHRHKSENDDFSKIFKIIEQKKYGISKISFLTLENK